MLPHSIILARIIQSGMGGGSRSVLARVRRPASVGEAEREACVTVLSQNGKDAGSRPIYVYCVSPKYFHSSIMESESATRLHSSCTVAARNDVTRSCAYVCRMQK